MWRNIDRLGLSQVPKSTEKFEYSEFIKQIQWAQSELHVALTVIDDLLCSSQINDKNLKSKFAISSIAHPTNEPVFHQRHVMDPDELLKAARNIREAFSKDQRDFFQFLLPLRRLGWKLKKKDEYWAVDHDYKYLFNLPTGNNALALIDTSKPELIQPVRPLKWLFINGESLSVEAEEKAEDLIRSWNLDLQRRRASLIAEVIFHLV